MAFRHFHKHSGKYLLFFFIATLFSLFTFNISGALTSYANSAFGTTGGAYLVFKTSSGREVGVDAARWQMINAEAHGALTVFQAARQFDLFPGVHPNDLAITHEVLLAEADELKIQIPPERADDVIERFKRYLQFQLAIRSRGNPVTPTVSDWRNYLRTLQLTEETLKERLIDLLKIEAYLRSVRGVHVTDPERMAQLFAAKNAKVGLDYVEFPFEKYKAELAANPPTDEVLEEWFKKLPEDVVKSKYTRDQRFTVDLALVDTDTWDPASVPAELLPATPDPTDDEVLNDVKRDAKRYTADGKAPAKLEDVTAEARAKVKKERQLKATLEKMRREFDAAVAELPAMTTEIPKLPDGTADPDAATKLAQARDERAAKEKQLFADAVAKYHLELKSFEDREQKSLSEIDPPKDASLQFQVPGLAPPGRQGLRTQQTMPGGANHWAFVTRVAGEPKPKEPKPFAEVKQQALDQWTEEHAKERALEKARELVTTLTANAEKQLPPDVLKNLQDERDQMLKRGEEQARANATEELTDAQKKEIHDFAQTEHWFNVQAALHGKAGDGFAETVKSLGLEAKSIAPQPRSISDSDHFNDRFNGAERFLLRRDDDGHRPALLGMDQGSISDVIPDDAEKSAYVARVASRHLPAADEMSPKDRKTFEQEEQYDWNSHAFETWYDNPFSIHQIVARNEPRLLKMSHSGGGYGY